MQCSSFSLQFLSCLIDRIANAVCRLGEELVVVVDGKVSRDTRFDGSRGEGQSVSRVQKRFGKRSSTCMVIMEIETLEAEGAVQQLAMPYVVGGRVVEDFIHFGIAIANITDFANLLEVLLLDVFSNHSLDSRHIQCSRSKPTSPHCT